MKFVKFFNTFDIPILGLGLSGLGSSQDANPSEFATAVDEALRLGYRSFDTAQNYGTEKVLGSVIKKWLESGRIKREELFITTKLPMIGMHEQRVEQFLQKSLTDLQRDYIDLYLIHSPVGCAYFSESEYFPVKYGKLHIDKTTDLSAIWKGMEAQVDSGKAKSIGISNFKSEQIIRILNNCRIPPANHQVEMNVYFPQNELREFCQRNCITVCAYSPFGSPGRKEYFQDKYDISLPDLLSDPVVVKIAEKHNELPSKILLRFLIERDVVVIPKTVKPERLKQNMEIFGFALDTDDMRNLDLLDKGPEGRKFDFRNFLDGYGDHPECPF